MKVLVISTLAIKWAGNQSLYNALTGLAEAGHKVYFLNIRKKDEKGTAYELHPNITIHHHDFVPKFLTRILRPLWLTLRSSLNTIEKFRNKNEDVINSKKKKESVSKKTATHTERNYIAAAPEGLSLNVMCKLSWTAFQLLAFYYGWRLIKKEKTDLLYGYEVWGAPVASLLGKIFSLPVVTRFQGTFLYPILHNRIKSFLFIEHILAMKMPANLIIMTNDGTRGDKVLEVLGVPQEKFLFLMNGVNHNMYDPSLDQNALKRELGLNTTTHVLLTVSKLAYWKRVDRAIRALPAVISVIDDVVLIVVGDGPERDNLIKLAEQLGVADFVKFVGSIPHSEVKKYLHTADVFLSLYDLSNLGNPLLEAMVCGRCIVTLNDGSISDLITPGQTGMLVDPSTISDALPKIIVQLLQNRDLRESLGGRAREYAEQYLLSFEQRRLLEVQSIEALASSRDVK